MWPDWRARTRASVLPSLTSMLLWCKAALLQQPTPEVEVRHDIIKSPNDDRDYAHLRFLVLASARGFSHTDCRLANGLEAMVVSEPDADKCGAAMCVDVGYWSDPEASEAPSMP